MNGVMLVFWVLVGNTMYYYESPIENHGYLNLTYCYERRNELREVWSAREDTQIIFIDCIYQGTEAKIRIE